MALINIILLVNETLNCNLKIKQFPHTINAIHASKGLKQYLFGRLRRCSILSARSMISNHIEVGTQYPYQERIQMPTWCNEPCEHILIKTIERKGLLLNAVHTIPRLYVDYSTMIVQWHTCINSMDWGGGGVCMLYQALLCLANTTSIDVITDVITCTPSVTGINSR